VGDGGGGVADAGDGNGANAIREVAFIFEQLEILVRATKERATGLALSYRSLDPLVLSARLVELAEAVGAVRDASSLTIHHLRNCASEVLING
jgi:hypothetical protein